MSARDKIIKGVICYAALCNKKAHDGNRLYYKYKFKAIKKALKLLQNGRHSAIQYKTILCLDQSGHPSNLTYFEWVEKTEVVQFSFHTPRNWSKGNSTCSLGYCYRPSGLSSIEWDEICDNSFHYLKKYGPKYLGPIGSKTSDEVLETVYHNHREQ